jgi:hypothetical protein
MDVTCVFCADDNWAELRHLPRSGVWGRGACRMYRGLWAPTFGNDVLPRHKNLRSIELLPSAAALVLAAQVHRA